MPGSIRCASYDRSSDLATLVRNQYPLERRALIVAFPPLAESGPETGNKRRFRKGKSLNVCSSDFSIACKRESHMNGSNCSFSSTRDYQPHITRVSPAALYAVQQVFLAPRTNESSLHAGESLRILPRINSMKSPMTAFQNDPHTVQNDWKG